MLATTLNRYMKYSGMGGMPIVLPISTLPVETIIVTTVFVIKRTPRPPSETAAISRIGIYRPSAGVRQ